jgi:hypothetical protein
MCLQSRSFTSVDEKAPLVVRPLGAALGAHGTLGPVLTP